jgi:hypothetical protein
MLRFPNKERSRDATQAKLRSPQSSPSALTVLATSWGGSSDHSSERGGRSDTVGPDCSPEVLRSTM